jgi:hypothetical protein
MSSRISARPVASSSGIIADWALFFNYVLFIIYENEVLNEIANRIDLNIGSFCLQQDAST